MRTVPSALQTHLDGVATTTTRLLKVTLRDGFTYGMCMSDVNMVYDDGDGEVTYYATNGFDPSTIAADTALTVGNAEGAALLAQGIEGIELEDVKAGRLDDAQWIMYLVNFKDTQPDGKLTANRHVILDAGDLGEVSVKHGIVWTPELLSYIMRLKQPVGSTYSRRCRAIFGSPADSQTGCGVDLTPLWVNGTVLSVGAETNRVFTGDNVVSASPGVAPNPGRVQFLTGDNAGREFAVEELDGEEVSLNETTNYAIQAGDTYRIRPDCGKLFKEWCIDIWDNGVNFKGEPLIPVGDASGVQSPGAQLGKGGGYVGDKPNDGD